MIAEKTAFIAEAEMVEAAMAAVMKEMVMVAVMMKVVRDNSDN